MIVIRYDHIDDTFEYFCCTQGEADFVYYQTQLINSKFLENNSYAEFSAKYSINSARKYESKGWISSDYKIVLKIISTLKDFDFSVELKEIK